MNGSRSSARNVLGHQQRRVEMGTSQNGTYLEDIAIALLRKHILWIMILKKQNMGNCLPSIVAGPYQGLLCQCACRPTRKSKTNCRRLRSWHRLGVSKRSHLWSNYPKQPRTWLITYNQSQFKRLVWSHTWNAMMVYYEQCGRFDIIWFG